MSADVIVIGGGASGLMAALFAARQGASVMLIEKNAKLGRKLRITGKGRCNLTNNCEVRDVLRYVTEDGRFLYSALNGFSPQDTIRFFEEAGLPLKTERGNRVFPVSDRADDVADLLGTLCRDAGVSVFQARAESVQVLNGAVSAVRTEDSVLGCKCCILCTGGRSYPLTGSTGDGYRFARSLGHTVTSLRPSLVPLESPDSCCGRLQGLSLRNIGLRVFEDDRMLSSDRGEMLFTHFGVSGPLVLTASAKMTHWDTSQYRLELDLKPALDEKKLDDRILRDLTKFRNRTVQHALEELLPHAMIPEVLSISEVPPSLQANSVTRDMRRKLLTTLKRFPIALSGPRTWAEAIVTAGGVDTGEVNPRSMESRLISGLFFAGELLNLDAYTGGFNLQIAWSTGKMAGTAAGQKSKRTGT